MNKYLTAFYKTTKDLAKELCDREWAVLSKLEISAEMESILDWNEFENIKLTDKEQEDLIEIIYDIYIDSENDLGVFVPTKAVMETLLDYGSYENFIKNYEENNAKVCDKIAWKLDY